MNPGIFGSNQYAASALRPAIRIAGRSLIATPITCAFGYFSFSRSPRESRSGVRGGMPSVDPADGFTRSSIAQYIGAPPPAFHHGVAFGGCVTCTGLGEPGASSKNHSHNFSFDASRSNHVLEMMPVSDGMCPVPIDAWPAPVTVVACL